MQLDLSCRSCLCGSRIKGMRLETPYYINIVKAGFMYSTKAEKKVE